MWNKISLRLRITLCSIFCLTAVCVVLTLLLIHGAGTAFVFPLEEFLPEGQTALGQMENVQISFTMAQESFALQSVWVMLGMILVGSGLIWYIAGRALRPISSLSRQVAGIDENRLGETLPVPDSKDEVVVLTKSFNQMLCRVNTAYEGQKTFARNAAHELKTPVAGILATIEVLKLDDLPSQEDYQEAIENITISANRMENLVQDLLLLNTALQKESFTYFNFSAVLENFRNAFDREIKQKNIEISLEGDVKIYGSQPLLTRAFENILHNAVRYNVQNGRIHIVCTDTDISITDTGIGIPKDSLGKIFDPFYCADPSRSRNLGGSGLGLNIAKNIFEQHNMQVQITSENGTKVKIII